MTDTEYICRDDVTDGSGTGDYRHAYRLHVDADYGSETTVAEIIAVIETVVIPVIITLVVAFVSGFVDFMLYE